MSKRHRKSNGPKEDLSGQRFGKLLVTGLAGKKEYPSGGTKYLWNCVCDCGNTSTPTGNALKRENTTSCRKCIFEDLSGHVFGKLTVKTRSEDRFISQDNKQLVMWECDCSCGNTHLVSSGNLKHGNVKSCGCLFDDVQEADFQVRTEKLLKKVKNLFGDKYTYDMSDFINNTSQITITCPEHGEFKQRVSDHLVSKTGCPSCSFDTRKLGLEEFIKRSLAVHGNKYDYSKVKFENTYSKVKIICPEHGEFHQLAKSHMDGRECFECSLLTRHWVYQQRCNIDPDFAARSGCVYLLRTTNKEESFLKIGVSVNIENRLACYRKEGLSVTLLAVVDMIAVESAIEENKLLSYIKDMGYKYQPINKFSGWTECADIQYETELLSYFDSLDKIYGSADGSCNRTC